MKRNQFLLTVIRLLVNTMFFYVLGAISANYVKNNNLLVKIDEAVVSQSIDKLGILQTVDDFVLFDMPSKYTYEKGQAIAVHMMNTNGIYNQMGKTKDLVEKSIKKRARVPNYNLDKPPRSDILFVNTS